jgi:3-mercaptopyruvate sulfurtransferase SseA
MPTFPIRATLRDSAWIALAGLALGLVANALSPRGLSLLRDYFPPAAPSEKSPAPVAAAEPGIDLARQSRLAQSGIRVIPHARAAQLFHDPRYGGGLIVFVDARDEAHYAAGHIPGAHPLDHYRLDRTIAEILAACAVAEQIVVYCNGGDCADSELVATDLLAFGLPASKLSVYAGGISEWQAHRLPLDTGPHRSDRRTKP